METINQNDFDEDGFKLTFCEKTIGGVILHYTVKNPSDNAHMQNGKMQTNDSCSILISEEFYKLHKKTATSLKQTFCKLFECPVCTDAQMFLQIESFKEIPSKFFLQDEEFVESLVQTMKQNLSNLLIMDQTNTKWEKDHLKNIFQTVKNKRNAARLAKTRSKGNTNSTAKVKNKGELLC